MHGSSGMTARRRMGLVGAVLLAVGAALGAAPSGAAGAMSSNAAGAVRSAPAGPPRASSSTVMRALGVVGVPAEIVVLVDISLSMATGDDDLYSTVRQDVLAYLGVLAQQEPQDLVGVILFGGPGDNRVIDPGPPSRHIFLPPAPYAQETDFGLAFQQAVQMLSAAQPDIKAGGVILLSDGEPSVPASADPAYGSGFSAPGWQKLRAQVQNLPIPVTAYDVPLTTDTTFTGNQYQALTQVFQPVQSLPHGTTNLSGALSLATQGILDSEVASAAAPDIGQGIRVRWSDLRGAGHRPLDLGTGHAVVTVTVTSTTQRVPLSLSGLSVTSAGLPVAMRGTLPGTHTLAPDQSATWHVRLSWRPRSSGATRTGGPKTLHGTLTLAATVSSSFTPTLRSTFGDTAFSLGGIQDGISPSFPVTEPVKYAILWLLAILLVGLLVMAGTGTAAYRARLSGTLIVKALGGRPHPVRLHGWRLSTSTEALIGKPGRVIVHGFPIRRDMKVHLRIAGRPRHAETLRPGQDAFPGGVAIVHQPHDSRARPGASQQ
jgi:hypothetical protein